MNTFSFKSAVVPRARRDGVIPLNLLGKLRPSQGKRLDLRLHSQSEEEYIWTFCPTLCKPDRSPELLPLPGP